MEKLPFKKRLLIFMAKNLIFSLIWLISFTCKKNFTNNKLPAKPVVIAFWHGRLAMMNLVFKRWWKPLNKNAKVIISDHKDGEIIAQITEKFGVGTIRGSSSKGAARALISAFREIKAGNDVAITPDGPRGPLHSIADGVVIIAQKMQTEIWCVNYEASRFWQFKSWDEMILPKPFSTINFSLNGPIEVENLQIETAKDKLKNELFKAAENDKNFK